MKRTIKILGGLTFLALFVLFIAVQVYSFYLNISTSKIEAVIPDSEGDRSPLYQSEIRKTTNFFRKLTYDWGVPSLSVAIAKSGENVYSGAFGYANLEDKKEANPNSPYRIHSVSKVLTSTLIAQLVEKQQLSLSDTVQDILHSYFDHALPFTVEQLLSHRSGIRHYKDDDDLLNKDYYPNTTLTLQRFASDSLLFKPGEKFSYSSYGYNVLGAILERYYDTTFQAILKTEISDKLDLKSLSPYSKNDVSYYEVDSLNQMKIAPYIDESVKVPSGGLQATPVDLIRFGNALLYQELINNETFNRFIRPSKNNIEDGINYGFGWESTKGTVGFIRILQNIGDLFNWHLPHTVGKRFIYHQGGSYGGMSMLVIYPEQELVFAFTSNGNGNLKPIYKLPMMGLSPYFKRKE